MRRIIIFSFLFILFVIESSAQRKTVGDKIKTDWAYQLNYANVLPEFPYHSDTWNFYSRGMFGNILVP